MKSGTYFLSEFILQLHMSNGPTKEWEELSLTSPWRSRKVCDDFGFDFCIVDSSFKYCFESNIFFKKN